MKPRLNIVTKNNTMFNVISKPVCQLMAPWLDVSDLKALSEASTSTHCMFRDALKLRHDAHIILQEVMNGSVATLTDAIARARETYGDNVWQLLLIPTYGRELHCNRSWPAESAIRFAARVGNFSKYMHEIRHMPPVGGNLELNKLYVAIETLEMTQSKILNYLVLSEEGKVIEDSITENDLGFELVEPLKIDVLKKNALSILAITSNRGHTSFEYPIKHLKLLDESFVLNILFSFIPKEVLPIAMRQLEDLYKSGEVMSLYEPLIDEYSNWASRDQTDEGGGSHRLLPWYGLHRLSFRDCGGAEGEFVPNFYISDCAPRHAFHLPLDFASSQPLVERLGFDVSISSGRLRMHTKDFPWGSISIDTLKKFVDVKRAQLGAFIHCQKIANEKYLNEDATPRVNRK